MRYNRNMEDINIEDGILVNETFIKEMDVKISFLLDNITPEEYIIILLREQYEIINNKQMPKWKERDAEMKYFGIKPEKRVSTPLEDERFKYTCKIKRKAIENGKYGPGF